MHDIWNPWHGCVKISEGCENCYMFFLDRQRSRDGSVIYKTKGGFDYPLQKDRYGQYKVKSGEQLRVCMNSDFFLPEADVWRSEAWDIIRQRPDVKFFLLTKRPERVQACLPPDWGNGWKHVMLNVTCENRRRADERIPILLRLPFQHKGIVCAPLIGEICIEPYLKDGQIEQVLCGGENYDGARPCFFEWVQRLREECERNRVTFCWFETGTCFVKDGKRYCIPSKSLQAKMAHRSGMYYSGRPMVWDLTDRMGLPLREDELYHPAFCESCFVCGSRPICNGCSACGKCKSSISSYQ